MNATLWQPAIKRLKVEKAQNLEGNKDCKDEMKLERNRYYLKVARVILK